MTAEVERTAARLDVVRSVPITVTRAEENGDGLSFEGYAAVWDAPTLIDSWEGRFREQIRRGAFRKSLSLRTPVLQFDHGQHPLIGSIPIGMIREAREDEQGVYVSARLHSGEFFAPVREAIASGSINGMSFRFEVQRDAWDHDTDDGIPMRELIELRVPELGPVVFPAYAETTASVRARAARYAQELRAVEAAEPTPETPSPEAQVDTGHPEDEERSAQVDTDHPDGSDDTQASPGVSSTTPKRDVAAEMAAFLAHSRNHI
jgi:uncharacterized protein